jgi:uncharacterized protein involved in exopolysaccharide biosynthesis
MDFNELLIRFAITVRQRKILFFTLFAVIFTAAVGGAYVKPQRFQSKAVLLVTLQSARINSSRSEEQRIVASVQPAEVMAAQVEIMKTRELTEELVDALPDWVFNPPPSKKWYVRLIVVPLNATVREVKKLLVKARLIEPDNERFNNIRMIEKGLKVFPVRKAQVIEVMFTAKNPEVPPLVLNTLIELYNAKFKELRAKREGVALYEARAKALSAEIADAERARAAFMTENNITNIGTERAQLMEKVGRLQLKADKARLLELIALEPQFNLLTRRVSILTDSYIVYKQAATDRQTFFERDGEMLAQLIDPPQAIYKPIKPSRLVLVLAGFVLSLVLALITVMLVEWVSQIRKVYGGGVKIIDRDATADGA